MRDIRADIKDRLAELVKERAEVESRREQIASRESQLKAFLREEDERWASFQERLFPEGTGDKSEAEHPVLSAFLIEQLRRGPRSKDDLVKAAIEANFPFGAKSPRRSIHFSLVGLGHKKLVRWTGELCELTKK